jgi:acetylornithine/succinyldiaminopimelate/putrescine aminotransferase
MIEELVDLVQQIKNKYNILIQDVIYHGMVGAIIFKEKCIVDNICKMCAAKGLLLVHTGRESIKLGPPIVITKKNLLKGFDIIAEVLNEFI